MVYRNKNYKSQCIFKYHKIYTSEEDINVKIYLFIIKILYIWYNDYFFKDDHLQMFYILYIADSSIIYIWCNNYCKTRGD